MRIDGIILAGGASSRMGAFKALLPLGNSTLIEAVIARIAPQVQTLAINVAPNDAETYRARFSQIVLPDLYDDRLGPLCGIVTGLSWCETEWLATFPCDTPFLPRDLVAQLAKHVNKLIVSSRKARRCAGCGRNPVSHD